MITVSEVLKNSCLKKYPVICGMSGLGNEVLKSGIIDYEFAIEGFLDEHKSFEAGDFLLSSLMFTNGDEELLMGMLKKLVDLKVSGLAVKNVFFKSLPQAVVEFCNNAAFPIILFDNEVFFEEIVSDIDSLLQLADWINRTEHQVGRMLTSELSRYEIEDIARDMGLTSKPTLIVYWIRPTKAMSQIQMKRIVESFSKGDRKSGFLLKYKADYLLLVTAHVSKEKSSQAYREEVLARIGLDADNVTIGASGMNDTASELDFAIKQAFWCCQIAELLGVREKEYERIGTWAVVAAHHRSNDSIRFMENYLEPILTETSEASNDLLDTLIAMVLCEGNGKAAARKLNIHENTYRYRINKIRERLDPNSNDMVFYENVSMAIRIHLLLQKTRSLR